MKILSIPVPVKAMPADGVLLVYDWDTDSVSILHKDLPHATIILTRSDAQAIQNLFDGKED